MDKKHFEIAKAITSITQAGLSVIIPVGLMIWLAGFLIKKFELPQFIMVIAIIIGAASGFYNMMKNLFLLTKNKEDK